NQRRLPLQPSHPTMYDRPVRLRDTVPARFHRSQWLMRASCRALAPVQSSFRAALHDSEISLAPLKPRDCSQVNRDNQVLALCSLARLR
ncbi:MAG TPA: hypothetical protein VFY10_08630, partial [Dehalococcoidia bacterium]|nr:hypothetical protein [Dehalococcoidia bacterium]